MKRNSIILHETRKFKGEGKPKLGDFGHMTPGKLKVFSKISRDKDTLFEISELSVARRSFNQTLRTELRHVEGTPRDICE